MAGTLRRVHTFEELLINRLAIVSTGWKTINSAMPAEPGDVSREAHHSIFSLTRAQQPSHS